MIKAESTAAVPILIWIKSTQRRVNGSLNLHETAHQGMKRRGRVLRGREEKRELSAEVCVVFVEKLLEADLSLEY